MAGIASLSGLAAGGSAVRRSGIGRNLHVGKWLRRWQGFQSAGWLRRGRRSSHSPGWRLSRRQNLALIFQLQLRDFRGELRLEFVRGALKLVERLTDLAGYLRQLLGPKNQQGQKEQKDGLGESHADMILPGIADSNVWSFLT